MVISSENGSTYNDANNHYFRKADSSEFMAKLSQNGSVELNFDNNKKFETVSNGVKVTSQLETTGDIVCGAELNLMGSSDANKYLDCRVGSNAFNIRKTTGGDASHETMAKFHGDGGVELYHNNVSKFITTATGATLTGALSVVNTGNASLVLDADSSQAGTQISFVDFKLDGTVEANIAVNESVTNNPLELNSATNHNIAMVTGGGSVGIGTTTPGTKLTVIGGIQAKENNESVTLTPTGSIELCRSGGSFIDFATVNTEDHDCRIKQESNGLAFVTGGNGSATEKMRVKQDGNVQLYDGNLIVASGHGIDFSATGDSSGTATSELFDDYEEGSFTPGSNATLTTAAGFYTKKGREVTLHIRITVAGSQSGGSPFEVNGFPFTAGMSGTTSNGAVPNGFGYISSGSVIPQVHHVHDGTKAQFYNFNNFMTIANVSGKEYRFGLVYYTA